VVDEQIACRDEGALKVIDTSKSTRVESSRKRGREPTRTVVASTDGACQDWTLGNGRKRRLAAWAVHWHNAVFPDMSAVLDDEDVALHTNQRAELRAVLEAVRVASSDGGNISLTVRTDSRWVITGYEDWMPRLWKQNRWRTTNKKPVKHADLWQALDDASRGLEQVKFVFVKGHAGDKGNERADALAVAAIHRHRSDHGTYSGCT